MPSTSSPVGVPKSHLGVGDLELTRWWRIITALSPVVVFVSAHRNFVSVGGVEKKKNSSGATISGNLYLRMLVPRRSPPHAQPIGCGNPVLHR